MLSIFKLKMMMAVLAAALLVFPLPGPSYAASPASLPSMLLTLDGIQGNFSTDTFKGAIVVSAFSSAASSSGSQTSGAGKPVDQDIQLSKEMDDSSLPLLQALAKGHTIRDGYLYFQSNSPKQNLTYMEVHLKEIRITGINMSSGGSIPMETISLQAKEILYKYTAPNPGGSSGNTGTGPIDHPKDSSVMTQYHFDPIYDTTSKGSSYIKGFRVTLKAEVTSSTLEQTQYRINGGSWVPYDGPFDIYAADTHSLEYFSTDQAGDTEQTNIMNFDTGTFTGNGSY